MADSRLPLRIRELSAIVSSPENMWKNPVSLLLEAAAHVGESANFNDVDELPLSHMELFTCEVKVGRLLKCRGTGPNKKTAKANAAESALEKIRNSAGLSGNSPRMSQVTPTCFLQQPSPAASVRLNTGSNPIGSLQEMCVKNNWPSPFYDLISETGKPHMKTFVYECEVGYVVAQGQGKSKKIAKKHSAEKALSMITHGGDPMRRKRRKHEKEKREKSKMGPLETRLVRKRNKIAVDKNMLSKLIGMKQLAGQLDFFSKELNNLIKLIERKFRRKKRI